MMFINFSAKSQIVISAVMCNTAGTDSAYEYVQLMATENINFATTNYSVVFLNNGSATVKGWANGLGISYKFNLTSGIVNLGDVFYVGGSGMKIDGNGSVSMSSLNWIRSINTGTTGGDGFGSANMSGIFGNAGTNADGVGVFNGITIDSTTVPIDAVFYGVGIGNAYNGSTTPVKGYQVPSNDHYNHAQGAFGQGTNTFYFVGRNLADTLLSFTGTYDTIANSWTTARTATYVPVNATSTLSALNPNITLVGVASGINKNDIMENITMFPNPTNGKVSINNPSQKSLKVEVLNLLGDVVATTDITGQQASLDLSNENKGIYFVRITNESGSRLTKKLILK